MGVDSVDIAAATARGIPVTNVPDTFIEEVADHTMMLILATYRRLVVMDRLVRNGRWAEGRPMLSEFPRLMGQTLGFIAFGHVARAVAIRARAFGLHMLAYDPYVEVGRQSIWRGAGGPDRTTAALRHRLDARTGDADAHHLRRNTTFGR